LDVTYPEPLPPTHDLYKLQNCFITPHIASGDVKLRHKMFQITAHNIINGLNGQPLVSEMKYTP
jgi:glyoxylate reductase